jgi:hypothetical protein
MKPGSGDGEQAVPGMPQLARGTPGQTTAWYPPERLAGKSRSLTAVRGEDIETLFRLFTHYSGEYVIIIMMAIVGAEITARPGEVPDHYD